MANSWIEHVKKYAAKHKMPYGKAISAARASYKKGSKSKTHSGKDFTGHKGDVSKSKGKDVKSKNPNRDYTKKAKQSSRKPDVKRAAKKGPMETAVLDDKTIEFRKGGLHKSLKVGDDYTFKRSELNKLKKVEVGDSFDFHKKKMKMTSKLKKQITLGLNLMKK
jgi:hypothetical protein